MEQISGIAFSPRKARKSQGRDGSTLEFPAFELEMNSGRKLEKFVRRDAIIAHYKHGCGHARLPAGFSIPIAQALFRQFAPKEYDWWRLH